MLPLKLHVRLLTFGFISDLVHPHRAALFTCWLLLAPFPKPSVHKVEQQLESATHFIKHSTGHQVTHGSWRILQQHTHIWQAYKVIHPTVGGDLKVKMNKDLWWMCWLKRSRCVLTCSTLRSLNTHQNFHKGLKSNSMGQRYWWIQPVWCHCFQMYNFLNSVQTNLNVRKWRGEKRKQKSCKSYYVVYVHWNLARSQGNW